MDWMKSSWVHMENVNPVNSVGMRRSAAALAKEKARQSAAGVEQGAEASPEA